MLCTMEAFLKDVGGSGAWRRCKKIGLGSTEGWMGENKLGSDDKSIAITMWDLGSGCSPGGPCVKVQVLQFGNNADVPVCMGGRVLSIVFERVEHLGHM